MDVNDDGELNEDEFVNGCLKDETLANLLNTGASEAADEVKEESKQKKLWAKIIIKNFYWSFWLISVVPKKYRIWYMIPPLYWPIVFQEVRLS